MTSTITRRKLLKLIAATTTAAALSPIFHARAHYPEPPEPHDKVDINAWIRMGRAIHTVAFYKEPSTSAARLNIRYRDKERKTRFCISMNNTVIASPRVLIPLLELNQNADGSINIPAVLQPYMQDKDKIIAR